ncbi:MAG: divalent metal cation transporter, partial [Edaphobacter sp.]
SILPLSTAYTVCEGLGLESGLDKSFKEARFFYWFYTLLLAGGAGIVLIFMLRLINKHELMGTHTNARWFNAVAWLTTAIVIVLSGVMVWNGLHT